MCDKLIPKQELVYVYEDDDLKSDRLLIFEAMRNYAHVLHHFGPHQEAERCEDIALSYVEEIDIVGEC